jgi:hypothetical protein
VVIGLQKPYTKMKVCTGLELMLIQKIFNAVVVNGLFLGSKNLDYITRIRNTVMRIF